MAPVLVFLLLSGLMLPTLTVARGADHDTKNPDHEGQPHRHHHHHHHRHQHNNDDHQKEKQDGEQEKADMSKEDEMVKTRNSHGLDMARSKDSQMLANSDEDDDDTDDELFTVLPLKYLEDDDPEVATMEDAPDGWSTPPAFPPLTTAAARHTEDTLGSQEEEGHYQAKDVKSPAGSASGEDLATQHGQRQETSEPRGSHDLDNTDDLSQYERTPPVSPYFYSAMLKDQRAADEIDRKRRRPSERIRQVKLANRPRYRFRTYNEEEDEEDMKHQESKDKYTEVDKEAFMKFKNRPPWVSKDPVDSETEDEGPGITSSERSKNRPDWDSSEQPQGSRRGDAKDLLDELEDYEEKKPKEAVEGARKTGAAWEEWKKKRQEQKRKGCPGCDKAQAGITKAKELRKMVLRDQLVDKLRLVPVFKEWPWPPKLPEAVFPDNVQHDEPYYDDQYYAKPTELLIFGRDLPRRYRLRKPATGSYQFGVTGKVQGRVTSAALWVYKMNDANDIHGQTLVVTELRFSKRKRLRERSLVMRIDTHVQEGWLRFDVTRLVQRWVKNKTPAPLQILAIRCKTCHTTNYRSIFGAKSNFRPVLEVHEQTARALSRERRTSHCDPSLTCCKFDLTLNFRDLGIHEIFYPRNIKVDYCYGTCDRPDGAYHNHTVLVQRHRFASYAHVNETMRERLKPCCVPVVLREASIMHYINDGFDTKVSIVPNILVDRCGCA